MASATPTTKQIIAEIPTYIRVFDDGTVERPRQAPTVPPSLDASSAVSSKDTVISHHPTISARLYLPKLPHPDQKLPHPDQKLPHPDQKLPILVFFHGGGFFFESAFSKLYHEHFNSVVPQINALVVSVEYRLAPEHPLPACYHDCWTALKWVASHSAETEDHSSHFTETEPWLINHGDFSRIFIGGDSAGGNIVHNIAIRAGIEALPHDVNVLGAVVYHPYFYGSEPIGSEPNPRPEHDLCSVIWDLVYPSVPGGVDNPVMNPLAPGAPSLSGLGVSKMIVFVAGKDGLRDRGVWYYEAVKNSGWKGKVELFEEEGEGHVYHIFHPESESSKKLIKRLIEFLDE